MENISYMALLLLAFLLLTLYEGLTTLYLNWNFEDCGVSKLTAPLFALLSVGALALCQRFALPLPALCVCHFPLSLLRYLPLRRYSMVSFWFWGDLRCVHFGATYMIALGSLALVQGESLSAVFADPASAALALCLSGVLLVLVALMQWLKSGRTRMKVLSQNPERLKQIVSFLWFAMGYVLFDAIPCMFPLPYPLLAWFLVGSSLLLLLQLYLFLFHVNQIAERAHYEAEYYRLEEQRAQRVLEELELRRMAYTDGLTGAYTRRYAVELLGSLLADGRGLSLAYVDLNGLKRVNDTMGHQTGDAYLIAAARALNASLRKSDTLSRIGGDEFLVIAPGATADVLRHEMERAGDLLRRDPCGAESPSFCFGISQVAPGEAATAEELLLRADAHMYEQKKRLAKREAVV